jgi:hypothetical protein
MQALLIALFALLSFRLRRNDEGRGDAPGMNIELQILNIKFSLQPG